jgi:hypothetical protein
MTEVNAGLDEASFKQIKAFLLEQLEEDGGSERARREVTRRRDIVVKSPTIV